MTLQHTETVIRAGSLKALFVGNELPTKPIILETLKREFDLDYANLPNSYPFDRYLQMLEWLRTQLYSLDPEAKGYEKLGRGIARGFFQGPVGQVLKLSIGVMGTQRSMRYFFRILGGALPFGKFEIVEERPGYIRSILYNVPGSPEIMRGMGLEAIQATNAKNAVITYRKFSSVDTEHIAKWED